MLYLAFPPKNPDGTFNRHEFVWRLAFAIAMSTLCGDWFVSVVDGLVPWIKANEFPGVFYAAVGAPAWWTSRAVAVWMHRRDEKDIGEIVKDVKELT